MSEDEPAGTETTSRGASALSSHTARAGRTAVHEGNGHAGGVADADTTVNLPTVGAPADPYLDRNARASQGSWGVPAVGNPTPAPSPRPGVHSAVDQYATLGLGGATTSETGSSFTDTSSGRPHSAEAASAVTTATPAPGMPAVVDTPAAPALERPAAPAVARTARRSRRERTPRRARLQLRHFNVWTVFKFSVVLAVALFFVWLIIVAVLYGTLDHLQVIDHINKTVRTIENNSSTNDAVTPRIVFTGAFLIGLLNIVLFILLTTIGAVVYNLCADLVGGIEVTLAERD